jgi:hypothetical protein
MNRLLINIPYGKDTLHGCKNCNCKWVCECFLIDTLNRTSVGYNGVPENITAPLVPGACELRIQFNH